MKTFACPRDAADDFLSRRPLARRAILFERDGEVVFDVDHQDYCGRLSPVPDPAPDPIVVRRVTHAEAGRAMWSELHSRWATASGEWDALTERAWLAAWLVRVPKINCGCRAHAGRYVTNNPPTLGTPADAFAWSIGFHNAVNARIGKAVVSLDRAISLWAATTAND